MLSQVVIASMAAYGVVATLGGQKMKTLVRNALDDDEFMDQTAPALLATALYSQIEGDDWVGRFERLIARHGDHWVVGEVARAYSIYYYHHNDMPAAMATRLENLCVDIALRNKRAIPSGRLGVLNRSDKRAYLLDEMRTSRIQYRASAGGKQIRSALDKVSTKPSKGEIVEATGRSAQDDSPGK